MGTIPALTSFVDATTAVAAEVNSNFTNVRDTFNAYAVLTDTAKTISVTHIYSASQTFTGGWTAGAACSISTGGFTVTAGGLTVVAGTTAVAALTATTGTFSGAVLVSAGGVTVTGNSQITGTFLVSSNLTLSSGYLAYGDSAARVLGGATSFAVRNNANSADNLLVSDAGAVTVRAGLTATTGTFSSTLTVNASVVLSAAQPVLRYYESDAGVDGKRWTTTANGGVFSLRLDNDADNSTTSILDVTRSGMTVSSFVITPTLNLTSGLIVGTSGTIGNGLTVTTGGLTVTGNSTITGTLGGVTTATITTMAGAVNFSGTPTFAAGLTVNAGTTATAALTATTGVFSSTVTTSGLTLSAASGKIIPGATSLLIRNNADSATNLTITDAGDITTRSSTTTTVSGALTVTGATTLNGSLTLSNFPLCRSRFTGAQTVAAAGVFLADSDDTDSLGMHDTGSNTSRFTVPTNCGGTYLCIAHVEGNTGSSTLIWRIDGTELVSYPRVDIAAGAFQTLTYIVTLTAGQYVELCNQTGGNSLTISSNSGSSYMQITRIL